MWSSADSGAALPGRVAESPPPTGRDARAPGHDTLAPEHVARLLREQPMGFCYLDAKLRYRYVNDRFCELTGVSRDEFLGRRVRDVLPRVAELIEPQLEGVLATGQPVMSEMIEAETRATEAEKGYYQHNFTPFRSAAGEIVGICCVVWGAGRRRTMENALMRARRLESIGRLAAGVAHEVNTPSQFVGDNLQFLRESFGALCRLNDAYARVLDAVAEGRECGRELAAAQALRERLDAPYLSAEIPQAIEQSLAGIDQITHIVQAMRQYSHPGSRERDRVRLDRLIETAIAVSAAEWKYVARIERDFDSAVPEIACHSQELSQVLVNLIVNAAHAIEAVVGDYGPKGTIRIATRLADGCVEIRVRDTGCGIRPEIREHVFDPFFTTKEVGAGTGQGLALAHRTVVEQHGGGLEFDTQVGAGTTFRVRLPLEAGARPGG